MTKFHVYMNREQNLVSWMVDGELVAVADRIDLLDQWCVRCGAKYEYCATAQDAMRWVYTEVVKSEVTDAATQ